MTIKTGDTNGHHHTASNGILYQDGDFEEWPVGAYLAKQDSNEDLIDGILPKEGQAMIYAPTGHMKTYMAITIGGCVATGTPFNKQAVEQGEVIYIAAEAPREVAKRIKAWQDYHGYEYDVMRFLPTTVRFKQEESLQRLDRYIASRRGAVKLVIFDTAARCASGVDEDSNSEVQQIVNDALIELIRKHKLTVLIVHHTGKDGNTPRGASAWMDACDTCARVETVFRNKSLRDTPLYTTLQVKKLRGGQPQSVAFRPIKQSGTLVLEGVSLEEAAKAKPKQGRPRKDSTPRKDGTNRQRGRGARPDVPAMILHCLEQSITTTKAMAESTGINEKTISNNLTTMRKDGIVTTIGGEWRKGA